MQGVQCLEFSPGKWPALTIDKPETPENKIRTLLSENPVIIFSRSSCFMCHVMKQLLGKLGVHPTVIQLDEGDSTDKEIVTFLYRNGTAASPAVFIGGSAIGGVESLMALHLSGDLVPKLKEVGALWI